MIEKYQVYPIDTADNFFEFICKKYIRIYPGYCIFCDSITLFSVRSNNLREDIFCIKCNSFNRQRSCMKIFMSLLSLYSKIKIDRLQDIRTTSPKVKIFNTSCGDLVDSSLKEIFGDNYITGTYLGSSYTSGEITQGGLMHQDLRRTSFADDSFDFVLTTDVLEHIPNPYEAFREIFRILKPGGYHIFTVPFDQTQFRNQIRATINAEGEIVKMLPAIMHHDPLDPMGCLVYTIFSLEMLMDLEAIGFSTTIYRLRDMWFGGMACSYNLIFASKKMGHSQ